MEPRIIDIVNQYYTQKIITHGATPAGVDWNSKDSQEIRFDQLLKLIGADENLFTILDYGCGYGSLYQYMKSKYRNFVFTGYDISTEMLLEAKKNNVSENICWIDKLNSGDKFDYVIASGIFNVRQNFNDTEWLTYILESLNVINNASKKGFAVNFLTSYSDADFMKDYLYYADPLYLFDYCKKNFSRNVSILHDYQLYEFTLIIRK
jgi:SAM-dependent methyltransferase